MPSSVCRVAERTDARLGEPTTEAKPTHELALSASSAACTHHTSRDKGTNALDSGLHRRVHPPSLAWPVQWHTQACAGPRSAVATLDRPDHPLQSTRRFTACRRRRHAPPSKTSYGAIHSCYKYGYAQASPGSLHRRNMQALLGGWADLPFPSSPCYSTSFCTSRGIDGKIFRFSDNAASPTASSSKS